MPAVRVAMPGDWAVVTQALVASDLPLDGLQDAWRTFVVEDSSGIIGVSALERYWDENGTAFLLRSVAVRPDARARGIGRAAALDAADHDVGGRALIGLLTESAQAYFERFGFHSVRREQLPATLDASTQIGGGVCGALAQALLRGDQPLP